MWIRQEKCVWSWPASRSGRTRWGGWGTKQEAGKGVSGFEDSRQNYLKATSVQVAEGQTGTLSQSRGQSLFSNWCRRQWVAGLPRSLVGRCSRPPTPSLSLLTESSSGRPECHLGAREAISSHCSLPSPGCSPKSASITQHFMSLPGCSALAELNSPCHVCAENTHFWRVQPTLLQALIIINYEEKWEDALLLYLYEYVHVYLYTYKTKILCPNTWIFQVQGKKTFVEMVSAKWTFFSFPGFKESKQGLWCRMWTIFLFFFLPILAYGGHKLTGILLCTAFVNFYFLSEFCHLRCFVGKSTVLCWLFSVVTGEKKKKNVNMELHTLDMVIFACWVVCTSWCWTGITRSLPQSVQGVSFAIVIFFLKVALLQCWLKFVCLH